MRHGGRLGMLICNIILLLLSLFMIAVGIVMVIGRDAYGSMLSYLKNSLQVHAAALGATNLDVTNLDILFITQPMGAVAIVFGVLFLVVSILGIIAAGTGNATMAMVSLVCLGIVFFVQTVIMFCVYVDRSSFDGTAKSMLRKSIDDWIGIDGEDETTLGWSAIMVHYDCCGLDDYNDVIDNVGWTRQLNGANEANVRAPFTCCIDPATDGKNCAKTGSFTTETYYLRGCYTRIWGVIVSHSIAITFFVGAIVFVQFLCIFFAVWVICMVKSKTAYKVGDYYR